ncbi:8f4ebdc5-09fd-4852-8a71-ab544154fde7 [Sclerotinia trifoliorum]|uniref:Small ribosomal subunit protein mS29 n=1 Tax=Sclerotinia trifoliorum TaxID=28548 RepID=A0A8H2ZKV8_9HELO|nr:8f4ebdc5-09fd-4852-8a71-ab544154fde7 [Sclerotinia trifoliorum]
MILVEKDFWSERDDTSSGIGISKLTEPTADMASSGCWKCLSRPNTSQLIQANHATLRLPVTVAATAGFSTSAVVYKNPLGLKPKGPGAFGQSQARGGKTLKIKKKPPPVRTGKPPAQGERKALRKRIVLSNTNALEVELEDLGLENVGSEKLVTKVVGLSGSTVDSLRASEAFKVTQGWNLFRRPALLVRQESLICVKLLEEAQAEKKTERLVVDGGRVSGKSLMLLHAMASAFIKGWIVLHIADTQELVNACTEYAPIPDTTPTLFSQNTYTAAWLERIGKANEAVLDKLSLSQEHSLPIPVQENISLLRLCELGAREPDYSWPIFQAFWKEITAEGRPPVLMSLDGLQWIMQNSLYRNADFELIHAHDLAVINHFVQYLSGEKSLPNGGAVLAATSRSHAPISRSMDLAILQQMDRQSEQELTERDPFEKKYDEKADKALQNMQVMWLNGLSKKESRSIMEYWAQSGVLRQRVDEKTVTEKWALAGNGIVGELERGALKMRI